MNAANRQDDLKLAQLLYNLALHNVPALLRKKALEALATAFGADFAFWSSGDLVNGYQVITTFNWRGPLPSFETAQGGIVFQTVVASEDRATNIRELLPFDVLESDPTYKEVLGPQGLRHALVLSDQGMERIADLRHVICLARTDETHPFSEQDRLTAARLLAVISAVIDHNLQAMAIKHGLNDDAIAVCDWTGRIYQTNQKFDQLMDDHFNGARQHVPIKFMDSDTAQSSSGWHFTRRFLEYEDDGFLEEQKAFYLVTVTPASALEKLSKREAEIAGRVAKGESYKVIANALNIAPSTVGNAMRRVFQKLGVNNRAGLVAIFEGRSA
ncbi:MAG: helix-turn-helix transcriptional regulator [Alphaproteobacteria bacterium]